MAIQQPKQKSFFAKYWWAFAGGAALIFIALAAAAVLVYLFVLKGEAKVTDLSLSSGKVEYGKKIEAVVTVKNNRVLGAKYAGKITVDGVEKDLSEVEVPSGEFVEVDYSLSSLKPGRHKIAVGELEKELRILKPAELAVSGLTLDPSESVLVGGTVTVSAKVKNAGEVEGTYMAMFTCDGARLDPISVTVGPGGEEPVTLSIPISANGTHEISIESLKQSFTAYLPANIAPVELKLAKTLAKPGEKVAFTVSLVNAGDLSGDYPLEVLVNGKSVYAKQVTVDGGKQVDVPLEITEDKAGKYAIKVGEFSQTLQIVTITRPKNGFVLSRTLKKGSGRLKLINEHKDMDAFFVLVSASNPKAALLTVYVRAGGTVKNISIKDGTYYIYYSLGNSFDSSSKRFITKPYYGLSTYKYVFKTTARTYSNAYIKLVTSGGNDAIDLVDSEFPK